MGLRRALIVPEGERGTHTLFLEPGVVPCAIIADLGQFAGYTAIVAGKQALI